MCSVLHAILASTFLLPFIQRLISSVQPKFVLHIVGGKILLHQFFVRRRRGVIFASFNFGITQSLVLAYIA